MATQSITLTFRMEARNNEKRIYCNEVQLREYVKNLRRDGKTFIQGNDSIYCMNSKVRYILEDSVTAWPNYLGEPELMTPGEIARTELKRAFGKEPKYARKPYLKLLDILYPPHFWDCNIYENVPLYYLDLSSAYFQIYRWLSLDLAHPRGLGNLLLFDVAKRLERHKPARNAVIGIARSSRVWMTKGGVTKEQPFHNPFLSPPLWHTVQAVLHEIATTAIRGGCVYVATDGYIFTSEIDFLDFKAYLDDNQFVYKTEQSEGYLTGWSSYSVGGKTTKVKQYGSMFNKHDYVNRDQKGYVEWLGKVRRRSLSRLITGEQ